MASTPHVPPGDFPWSEIAGESPQRFDTDLWTERILVGMSDPAYRDDVVQLLHDHARHCVERLHAVERALQEEFVGKEEIIRMVIVSAIAQQPLLLLGPPGVAKTRIVARFCELLGVARAGSQHSQRTCFQYLIHSFTEPNEILGLLNLEELKGKDGQPPRYRRLHEGSITDSEVVFLDEVFRGNSAILNSLLSIINERRVYEGGGIRRAKARLIFGASNAIPSPRQMEELTAFFARFVLRIESSTIPFGPVGDGRVPEPRRLLLEKAWDAEVRDLRAGYDPDRAALAPVACLNDVLFLNRAATELWGGENLADPDIRDFVELYHQAVTELSGPAVPVVVIDDRRFVKLFLLARAHALFVRNGRPVREDLCVLRHTWDDLQQRQAVFQAIDRFIRQGAAAPAARRAASTRSAVV